jgi:probable F420-dependent oxidoreductase
VLDPIGVLTLAASVTTRIRVGTSVLVAPWYPPVLLARSLTTLDHISGGRLDVGLGVGWSKDEYEAAGVTQRHVGARLDETLDVLEAAWGPDPVHHTGAHIRIAPSHIGPKPVQSGGPPVLLAAFTPAGLDRVARRADGWNPSGLPVAAIGPMWRAVLDLSAGHGRDPDRMRLVVRANIDLTERPAGPDRSSYVGTIDQVAADLQATAAAGADEVILGCFGDPGDVNAMLDTYAALVAAAGLTLGA